MPRLSLCLLLVSAAGTLAPAALAGAISIAEFDTSGDSEGFTLRNAGEESLLVADGVLKATATKGDGTRSTDPQLHKNFVESADGPIRPEPGQTFSTLEFRARETDESGKVVAKHGTIGLIVVINGKPVANGNPDSALPDFTSVDSGDGFFTFTTEISTLGATPLSNLRLDVIGGPDAAGNTFEVDFIHVHTAPEPG